MALKGKKVNAEPPQRAHPSNFRWFFGSLFNLFRRHGSFLCGCLLVGYCAHVAGDAAQAVAGRQTGVNVNFLANLFANFRAEFVLSITLAGSASGLYLRERKNHQYTRERLTRRISALESRLDPARSSSKLTSKGMTRKDDL
jgi:hypothetical protein